MSKYFCNLDDFNYFVYSFIASSIRTTEKGLPLFVKLDGTVVFVEDVKTVWFTQERVSSDS